MAVSPHGVLGRETCRHTPGFSDSTAIVVQKPATLWLNRLFLSPTSRMLPGIDLLAGGAHVLGAS